MQSKEIVFFGRIIIKFMRRRQHCEKRWKTIFCEKPQTIFSSWLAWQVKGFETMKRVEEEKNICTIASWKLSYPIKILQKTWRKSAYKHKYECTVKVTNKVSFFSQVLPFYYSLESLILWAPKSPFVFVIPRRCFFKIENLIFLKKLCNLHFLCFLERWVAGFFSLQAAI